MKITVLFSLILSSLLTFSGSALASQPTNSQGDAALQTGVSAQIHWNPHGFGH